MGTMPRLKMILNPAADHGHAAEKGPRLREVIEGQVRGASNGGDYTLSWVSTERPRHAVELAHEAAQEGYDVVVAIGGDGTVHEVVNGLMRVPADRRPLLGVVPVGSGNDFAYNIGLPADPLEAVHCLLGTATRAVDVGLITDETGRQEYWDNTIGIGFTGAVNIAAQSKTRWRGFMLYFISVLETIFLRPVTLDATLEVDGGAPRTLGITTISICNGPREGGGFPVAPDACVDDGLITYTIMRRMSRFNMLRFLPVVMQGQHLKHPRFFESGTARHMRIQAAQTMAIHVDGEVFGPWEAGLRRVEVSILPQALRVLCRG